MAKSKNKKLNSDKIRAKGKKVKAPNPFEYKVAKTKFETLNTKVRKHQKSQPGQSRIRANQIREQTIGVEYKRKHKKNVFVDGRINAKSSKVSTEDDFDVEKFAILARKKLDSGKERLFNAGNEEEEDTVLTHRGKSLADMERLESPVGSDAEDDNPFSAGNLTAEQTEAMFGGGVFEKKRDHKEIMLDVIAKSKKFKYERQKEKEEVTNAFEQLDANYKNILQMTSKFARNEDDKYEDRKENNKDDFSRLMREMKFDKRVQPGVRQKSATEIAEATQKQRDELLRQMRERMKDSEEEEDKPEESVEHIPEKKEEVKECAPLAYSMKDGTLLNNKDELAAALRNIQKVDGSDDDEESDVDGEEPEIFNGDEDDDEEEGREDEDEEEESADEEERELGDIDEEADEEEPTERVPTMTAVLEKASTVLSSGKNFRKTLMEYPNKERIVFLSSLAKKIISGTDADRPLKLRSLFDYTVLAILRHEVFDEGGTSIAPILFELADKAKPNSGHSVSQMLREFANKPISIEFVRLVSVIASLYSVSDFNHKLGIPTQIIAVKMLSKIRARSVPDIALGLYLTSLLIQTVSLSNNFVPELYAFLESVLSLCLEPDERSFRIFPSFRLSNIKIDLDEDESVTALNLESPTLTSVAVVAVQLISKLTKLKPFASNADIFGPLLDVIKNIPFEDTIKESVVSDINSACLGKYTLLTRKKKVKSLQMYEPKIDGVGAKREVSRQKRDIDKMTKKLRDEKRKARKETVKDSHFKARLKRDEQMKKDEDRRNRTKRIIGQLANQEGEAKSFKKKKYNLFPDM